MDPGLALPAPGEALLLAGDAGIARPFLPRLADWLADADAQRLRQFTSEPARLAFATGRLLIGLLDRAAHGSTRGPRLARGPHGKPAFAGPTPWRFNLSHAGGRVLLSATLNRETGVDLESPARRSAYAALAGRAFHPAEREWWTAQGATPAAFLRIWTLKEAWLKTGGEGITIDLREVNVLPWLHPSEHGGRTAFFPSDANGYISALVVEGALRGVRALEATPATLSGLWRG